MDGSGISRNHHCAAFEVGLHWHLDRETERKKQKCQARNMAKKQASDVTKGMAWACAPRDQWEVTGPVQLQWIQLHSEYISIV